jgi:hypothetical protein
MRTDTWCETQTLRPSNSIGRCARGNAKHSHDPGFGTAAGVEKRGAAKLVFAQFADAAPSMRLTSTTTDRKAIISTHCSPIRTAYSGSLSHEERLMRHHSVPYPEALCKGVYKVERVSCASEYVWLPSLHSSPDGARATQSNTLELSDGSHYDTTFSYRRSKSGFHRFTWSLGARPATGRTGSAERDHILESIRERHQPSQWSALAGFDARHWLHLATTSERRS